MPIRMECPFFKKENNLKLYCEGAKLIFPDNDARREYVLGYCAGPCGWRKCSIAQCLVNYYDRRESG